MSSSTTDAAQAVQEARARLRASLDALSAHVSPAGALDMARSIVEDHETRRAATDFVKRNPLPTALAATGLAWLGYKLLSSDDDKLADPRRDPGLTEVAGRPHTPHAPPPEAPYAQEPYAQDAARQDLPHTPMTAPEPPPAAPKTAEVSTFTKVRRAFSRHPLLYGVVGLVAGAIAGVVAAVKRSDDALEAPDETGPEAPATYAAGEPAAPRPGNGVMHRPRPPARSRPSAN